MDKFFDSENPLMVFLSRLVDLAILNVLTVCTSMLIVTAGGAMTAMNNVLLHLVRRDETYVTTMFWTSFKKNFRQGIPEGLLVLAAAVITAVDMWALHGSESKAATLLMIVITIIAGLVAPESISLVGFLMFGNLIRECGVLNSLSETAQKVLANLVTIFLGITVATQMQADKFLKWETILILLLGLFGFIFDTFGGVMFAKFLNLFSKTKINPMIGAAGISAFPMSARVVHKMGLKEDDQNFLLMHSIGVNVSGQIASVIAGGLILTFFG
jgi:Na+-transporting methylmalonyl-CoA/oxaloacetate decarboxylase beta subunit